VVLELLLERLHHGSLNFSYHDLHTPPTVMENQNVFPVEINGAGFTMKFYEYRGSSKNNSLALKLNIATIWSRIFVLPYAI